MKNNILYIVHKDGEFMRIGIDIDDTVSETEKAFILFEKEYDKLLGGKGIVFPNRRYWHKYDWTEEEQKEFLKKYFLKIIENCYPIIKSQKIISKLKEEGNEIIFITARSDHDGSTYELTYNWLKNFEFPVDKLIIGAHEKGNICKDEKIDIFIDDSPHQCLDVKEFTDALVIGFNQENNDFICAKNWDEVYEIIHNN